MHRLSARSLVALLAVSVLTFSLAASEVIGVAVASGGFQVNGSYVSGNATLFEGNTLETGSALSELRLHGGVRMLLASDSRATVYRDRLVLEKGLGELENGRSYSIEARGLRIRTAGGGAAGQVALSGDRRVRVAARSGEFQVLNARGSVVAILEPGRALEFEPLPVGAQIPFEMTGCLEMRDGHYVLRDLVAGVVEELRGERLDRHVGYVVEVTAVELPGIKPVAGAMEVIQVQKLRRVRRGCPAPPPGVAPAPPAAPKPTPTAPEAAPPAKAPPPKVPPPKPKGMSGAAKAVIAGVIVGGAGAGAALYLMQKEEEETISP